MNKRLRSGFTTGACAAAAAKAAALLALNGKRVTTVDIPFPDGSRIHFPVARCSICGNAALACIIKDAGDDPDVTNGAEICATVGYSEMMSTTAPRVEIDNILLTAGQGIGYVTKPGLAVQAGEPAINPVPRRMICEAVREVEANRQVTVTVSIPQGEILAEKTLNHRLGIVGGLSVLGTTGIVRPISADAWKATIEASMSVARKANLDEVVLSTGRTSEKGAQSLLTLPEEAYAMMGDYLQFSLQKAAEFGFSTIHLAGMWAKIVKAALRIPQTHVRNGALEMQDAATLLQQLGAEEEPLAGLLRQANTAREMLVHLQEAGRTDIITQVCRRAAIYGHEVSDKNVAVYLVDASAKVVMHV